MNDQDRQAFEKYRDDRNMQLEREDHKPGSKWHVTNAHWSTWEACQTHARSGDAVATVAAKEYLDGSYAGNQLEWVGRNAEDDFPVGTKLFTHSQPDIDVAQVEAMRHSANEWADMATNGIQQVKNILAGITQPKEALEQLEKDLAHCRGVNRKAREANSQPAQAEQEIVIDGNTSDGYHTFNELYEFRKVYNAALFNEWAANGKCSVHKSWRHHDGELCFGGGWFIVVAVLPTGQISNHYEAKDWDLFSIPETEKALFEFDGHTGKDVIERLKSYTPPAAQVNEQLLEALRKTMIALRYTLPYMQLNKDGIGPDCSPVFQALLDAGHAVGEAAAEAQRGG